MGGVGGGRLFEGGRLLTFSAFRMGAYPRWALIRINTVVPGLLKLMKIVLPDKVDKTRIFKSEVG